MTATQINLSEHILKQHESVRYSSGYSKLGAQGKDFQNWCVFYFPFLSQNHSDL